MIDFLLGICAFPVFALLVYALAKGAYRTYASAVAFLTHPPGRDLHHPYPEHRALFAASLMTSRAARAFRVPLTPFWIILTMSVSTRASNAADRAVQDQWYRMHDGIREVARQIETDDANALPVDGDHP